MLVLIVVSAMVTCTYPPTYRYLFPMHIHDHMTTYIHTYTRMHTYVRRIIVRACVRACVRAGGERRAIPRPLRRGYHSFPPYMHCHSSLVTREITRDLCQSVRHPMAARSTTCGAYRRSSFRAQSINRSIDRSINQSIYKTTTVYITVYMIYLMSDYHADPEVSGVCSTLLKSISSPSLDHLKTN